MEKKLDKLEGKIDKVLDEVSTINQTLARNTKDLEYHIRRTTQIEDQLMPLVKKATMLEGMLKLVGAVATFAGLVIGALKLWKEWL